MLAKHQVFRLDGHSFSLYHPPMIQTSDLSTVQNIYTVSRLNNEVRSLLENAYPFVWVEGEISNFAAPNSGHWYFCMKDATAQVRCAMFKGHQRKLGFIPKDGMHVLVKARISLYEGRGEFQMIAEFMEERGEGKLRKAFELLKKKLEGAGLFNPELKKPLPLFPRQIGVVTSPTGAAIRDILTVLKRRFHCVPVIIYPTLVQGNTAAPTIVQAIEIANRRKECDVLIIARGGGSLEDLWPFNEESVAQAIFKSELPIISAVGHEVDFTIADFVADKRAATPSAAAEIITPDKAELNTTLIRYQQIVLRQIHQHIGSAKKQLVWTQKHLSQLHPKRRLLERAQQLDFLEVSLTQLVSKLLNKLQTRTKDANAKLHALTPEHRIHRIQHQLAIHTKQLQHLMLASLQRYQTNLANAAAKLDALSPLATLKRGYAIAMNQNQHILRQADEVNVGDKVKVRLEKGVLTCDVVLIEE